MKHFQVLIFTFLISFSISAQPARQTTPSEYIELYRELAISEMLRSGVPASIKLAQGILESGNGNSQLSRVSNNHFGIKCRNDWTGPRTYHDDDEKGECFRVYGNVQASYKDHSDFLRGSPRYAFLFELDKTDYKAWAKGLKSAGYATNPNYAPLLINIIERHNLNEIDLIALGKGPVVAGVSTESEKFELNGIPAIRAREGDTYESIARRLDMMPWQIRKYNELEKWEEPQPGMIIYLKPKNKRHTEGYHTVSEGETIYEISQQYGVKLKPLLKRNRMDAGLEPAAGERIYLRKRQRQAPRLITEAAKADEKELARQREKQLQPVTPIDTSTVPQVPLSEQKPVAEQPRARQTEKLTEEEQVTVEQIVEQPKTQQPEVKQTPVEQQRVEETKPVEPEKHVVIEETKENEDIKVEIPVQQRRETEVVEVKEEIKEKTVEIIAPPVTSTSHAEEFHMVAQGETLFSISRRYGLTVDRLREMNRLQGNTISVGQKLRVSEQENKAETRPSQQVQVIHVVEPGDTLFSLSRKYQTTVEMIMKLNNLPDPGIRVGDSLVIK